MASRVLWIHPTGAGCRGTIPQTDANTVLRILPRTPERSGSPAEAAGATGCLLHQASSVDEAYAAGQHSSRRRSLWVTRLYFAVSQIRRILARL